jgi:hypothetical protein
MAVEVSPNTSTTRKTNISVETPDTAALNAHENEHERIDKDAKNSAERAANRINDNKTNVPGSSVFTK